MYRIILCATPSEAAVYAREQGWKTGTYRFAARASTIRGLRVAEIHQLPSWERRLDKHAVENTFRFARALQRFLIDDGWTWPRPKPGPEQPELPFDEAPVTSEQPLGPQTFGEQREEWDGLPPERVNDPEAAALDEALEPEPPAPAPPKVDWFDEPAAKAPKEPEPKPAAKPKRKPTPAKPKAAAPRPEPQPVAALDFGSGATDWFS